MNNKNLRVVLPLERLEACWPRALRGARVGALLHPASISSQLVHSAEILAQVPDSVLRLRRLFGPQHGYRGETQDNMVEWTGYRHPRLGIRVVSLYGRHREPTDEMLRDLDAMVVDLQDVGARYYTFVWTLYLCMRACVRVGIPLVVLDRPNPINGSTVEGPVLQSQYASFVGLHPIPARHGKTIGQLARQFRAEAFGDCDLVVLEMQGWEPDMWFDQTGLPWAMPSPNMPTLDTATVYPGMCLLEGTNLSEGRGTTRPFELFGAPFLDPDDTARGLNDLSLPGVRFRPAYFQPAFQKFAGRLCGGAHLHVLDRSAFEPFRTGVEVLRWIRGRHRENFAWKKPPYEYETEKLPIEVLLGAPVDQFFPETA